MFYVYCYLSNFAKIDTVQLTKAFAPSNQMSFLDQKKSLFQEWARQNPG